MNEWSARRGGRYLHNTQQTQDRNIQAFREIRTRDRSNEAASDHALDPTATGIGTGIVLHIKCSLWFSFVRI
jgi:hypothetical protein